MRSAPRSAAAVVPDWQKPPADAPYWSQPRVARTMSPAQPFVEDEIVAQGPPTRAAPPPTAAPADSNPAARRGELLQPPAADPMRVGPMTRGAPVLDEGTYDDGSYPGGWGDEFGSEWGPPCDDCGFSHDGACDPLAYERFHICSIYSFLNEASIFVGPQAFRGPIDTAGNGNFGLHAGANLGDVVIHKHGLGYQIGGQYVGSNLSGSAANNGTRSARHEGFLTAGLFHRAYYNQGFQFGAVVDYLSDSYYVNTSLTQLRYEVSYLTYGGHEFGYWGAASSRTNTVTYTNNANVNVTQQVRAINTNNLFYRRNLANGAQGRVWGGFTGPYVGNGQRSVTAGILGGDFRVPMSNRFEFVGGFQYIIPGNSGQNANNPAAGEAWGMTMSLVFYPGRWINGVHNGPYRPLFDVANNMNFMVDSQP